ncbi:MAG TPA: hypothetical protein PK867_10455 [Pirellulales bacterium]|nr:hypothetical protein [Pirellulales bacterium]
MRKWMWLSLLSLPLAMGGLVYASSHRSDNTNVGGYVCPVTGEELPYPNCCPLKHGK